MPVFITESGNRNEKTVDNFQPAGGMHCITNAMKQIFNFYGHPLSEEMLFGLGEGLDFAYINMAHSPMVSGRSKIIEFEGILSKRLGVGMKFRKGRDNNKSFEAARKMIDDNQPVLIYADMPYLPYMSLDPDSHFGGIMAVCDKMLNPQARLKGICGIEKFGKEIIKWGSFDAAKQRTAAITNYFQISADGGPAAGFSEKCTADFCLRRQNCLKTAVSRQLAHTSLKLQRSGILWQMNCGRWLKKGIAVSCSIYLKKSGRCMTRNMIYTAN